MSTSVSAAGMEPVRGHGRLHFLCRSIEMRMSSLGLRKQGICKV